MGTMVIYMMMTILPVEMAKAVSISTSLAWNYFGSRRWVFNTREVDER
jgi:putative flippase GtrA